MDNDMALHDSLVLGHRRTEPESQMERGTMRWAALMLLGSLALPTCESIDVDVE